MATLKDIQDAIDNKTFDPIKLSPKQRRLVDEAIKEVLSKDQLLEKLLNKEEAQLKM